MKTIHYMTAGYASCGFEGLPSTWPEDHLWANEWEHVTCAACLEKQKNKDLQEVEVKQKPKQAGQKNKTPCYTENDPMPFGKYKGQKMQDVPANYLCWLWSKRPITDAYLENYIHNNINALKKEHKDGIWT
jgi:uncharacterized protein (DUF3820 family)